MAADVAQRGSSRIKIYASAFSNHVSESFHNGSKVEKALGLGFMVELNATLQLLVIY